MTSTDELDRIWRDALTFAASELVVTGDPAPRVARRVRRRRRTRRAATVVSVVALSAAALLAIIQIGHHDKPDAIATRRSATITAIVQVEDAPGGVLAIVFPGRSTSGNPPTLALPSGLIRFEIHGSPGHSLVIDGISSFHANFTPGRTTISQDVQLSPGEYLMHCTIPGHTEAGEHVLLRVSAESK